MTVNNNKLVLSVNVDAYYEDDDEDEITFYIDEVFFDVLPEHAYLYMKDFDSIDFDSLEELVVDFVDDTDEDFSKERHRHERVYFNVNIDKHDEKRLRDFCVEHYPSLKNK